jgi:hypothetical protein
MDKINSKIRILPLAIIIIMLIAGGYITTFAQLQKEIRVGEAQCYFLDYGSEPQTQSGVNYLVWPAQYGDNQHTTRMKGLWLGCTNFNDPVEGVIKSVKVIGAGPRLAANQFTMTFPQSIEMIGRYYHPQVIVDGNTGTSNILYDELDGVDENLPCDRMIIIKFNTSMGVSVKRTIMAFTQQNHDNYFIQEYIFTNTGKYNADGDIMEQVQTLQNFWVYFTYRYGFAGVTSSGFGSTWGSFASQWGTSNITYNFGPGTSNVHPDYPEMRGFYAWYGPTSSYSHPLTPEEDWGCPDHQATGVLGSAKYAGGVTLFASQGPGGLFGTDDPSQPATTAYTGSDGEPLLEAVSQYNINFMQQRYDIMREGHLNHTQRDLVEPIVNAGGYVENWTDTNPYRSTFTGGSTAQGQGFGPYTLAPGDSIRIVYAEGVSGISWEKCREVGANWYDYYTGTGSPEIIMPDGSSATDQNEYGYTAYNAYKRAWCETGEDSINQTLKNALAMYNYLYQGGEEIPLAPPAPDWFTVTSGGDRIRLSWADNAITFNGFDGYVIYRARGGVKDYQTVYEKIFECNAANVVHQFDDETATRGFDYFYYIQSKDDGSRNELEPGKPLYSSLFLTMTTEAARLLRPAGTNLTQVRVVPNPYDIRARMWQFGERRGGVDPVDRLAFYGIPGICKLKIFTERGDLIWEKYHDNGSGDELWDSKTSSGQIVVSGIYILLVEVMQNISNEESGELEFRKGETIYRKFVIIR